MESKSWWKEAVVYQIYPKSFMDTNGDGIGDIPGIISKLDYIKELGATVIWITPFYESPQVDNGYDISDYRSINPEFGTMDDFDRLLEEAHKRGLKIVADLVVNHTSDQNKWFVESRKSRDNPYRDYYIWKDGKDGKEPNNWGSVFSGSAWQKDEQTGQYYLHLFAKEQPDLNWANPKVRDEVFDMMEWWCKKGIDGFRMDVIGMIDKDQSYPDGKKNEKSLYGDFGPYSTNRPGVHEYLKEMNRRVLSKYDLITVGETGGVTVEDAKKYAGFDSHELNMVFQFERVEVETKGEMKWIEHPLDLVAIKKVFDKWQTGLDGVAWNSLYWENHDLPRSVSRYHGEGKLRPYCSKMLATCLYFQKGTPYIYQGQELGMTNNVYTDISELQDIESIRAYDELVSNGILTKEEMLRGINWAGRDNARTPMQWNDSENAGFSSGTPWLGVNPNYKEINAEAQTGDPDSVFSYFKKINELRKKYPVIVYGTFRMQDADNDRTVTYTREDEECVLTVICNFTAESAEYKNQKGLDGAKLILCNYKDGPDFSQNTLRPFECCVYLINKNGGN